MPLPTASSPAREFDVLVDAPQDAPPGCKTPNYAGTMAFFGPMMNMTAPHEVTFVVPLPKKAEAFHNLTAARTAVDIRVVPHARGQKAPVLKAVTFRMR